WLSDTPHFDIAIGDANSDSMRGLIGIAWKKMKPTGSLHAIFESDNLESIVVISDPEEHGKAELVSYQPMDSFELVIKHGSQDAVLKFRQTSTHVVSVGS